MIKINKAQLGTPDSLQTPYEENFATRIPRPSRTTNDRRLEVIREGKYIYESRYNSRYKQKDVKESLETLYNNKCAFCESKVESFHVEHYRPKKIYYWLAYSWDNLLLACPTCNQFKEEQFDIEGDRFIFESTDENIKNINFLSRIHDDHERPLLINPESVDPKQLIKFEKNGAIYSTDARMTYTINACKVNREFLNDQRRHIVDVFRRDINSALVESKTIEEQKTIISSIISKFVQDYHDKRNDFLAFRRFMLENWVKALVYEATVN